MSAPVAPPFFLVWCEDGGEPRHKHDDLGSALNEARRLAKACPGRRFYVLAPMSSIRNIEVEVQVFDVNVGDGIPF